MVDCVNQGVGREKREPQRSLLFLATAGGGTVATSEQIPGCLPVDSAPKCCFLRCWDRERSRDLEGPQLMAGGGGSGRESPVLTDSADLHPRGHWHARAHGRCAGGLVTTQRWSSLAQHREATPPPATQCPAQSGETLSQGPRASSRRRNVGEAVIAP